MRGVGRAGREARDRREARGRQRGGRTGVRGKGVRYRSRGRMDQTGGLNSGARGRPGLGRMRRENCRMRKWQVVALEERQERTG